MEAPVDEDVGVITAMRDLEPLSHLPTAGSIDATAKFPPLKDLIADPVIDNSKTMSEVDVEEWFEKVASGNIGGAGVG